MALAFIRFGAALSIGHVRAHENFVRKGQKMDGCIDVHWCSRASTGMLDSPRLVHLSAPGQTSKEREGNRGITCLPLSTLPARAYPVRPPPFPPTPCPPAAAQQ
eukprot:363319-Chlamydomonas_euryale.AAC.1